MNLSDEQLMLLEQLTYLNKDVAKAAGVTPGSYKSVYSLLCHYNEDALAELESKGGEYPKWAAIIRAIQADPELYGDGSGNGSLKIVDYDKDQVNAICYDDGAGGAIVTFKGTSGKHEWADNAYGLSETDTPRQKAALDYIENLPYDNVTVVGHSKGGNKAQYVTLLSDKVNRCVSMDGQGFSPEFLEKYYAEIENKSDLIRNYYLEQDYVNILLFPVPGSNQICIEGSSDVKMHEHHFASSFYQYEQDENGNWRVVYVNGETQLKPGQRSALMQYLHELTCFILNVMPAKDREEFGVYIGALLAILLTGEYTYQGKSYTRDQVMSFLLSDQEMFSMLLAYVMKYTETYELTNDEIASLLEFLGLSEFFAELITAIGTDPVLKQMYGSGKITLGDVFLWLMNQLKDGERDKIIEAIIGAVSPETRDLWRSIEDEYVAIPPFDPAKANQNGTSRAAVVRDFSANTHALLMNAITEMTANTFGTVSHWRNYASEDWYDDLVISNLISGITHYFDQLDQLNGRCREEITKVFDNANELDREWKGKLLEIRSALGTIRNNVGLIAEGLQ